jgi:RNA polymerase-binding transcription factor DksA
MAKAKPKKAQSAAGKKTAKPPKAASKKAVKKTIVKKKPTVSTAKPKAKSVAKSKPAVKYAKPVKKAAVKGAVSSKKTAKKSIPPKSRPKPVISVKKSSAVQKPNKKGTALKPSPKKTVPAKTPPKPSKPSVATSQDKKKTISRPVASSIATRASKPASVQPVAEKKSAGLVDHRHESLVRYSDADLLFFRNLIDQKMKSAREELQNLKENLDNHTESQSGNKAWNMEDGTDTSDMENMMNQIARQHQYIRNLELAMVRVENKTYGICRVTGGLIPKQRLILVPHATMSIEAKKARRPDDMTPGAGLAENAPGDLTEFRPAED